MEYISGGISQRKLADKHGVSAEVLMQKANREHWKSDRDKTLSKSIANVQQKTADAAAENAVIAERIKKKGLALLERMIDDFSKMNSTEHRDITKTTVDIKRLRDLTAAYKDLTDGMKDDSQKTEPVRIIF